MPHSKRDTRKYRGSRTHGYGRIGQHRKAGQRGGKGQAGLHKGGWTWIQKHDKNYFGKNGFKRTHRIVPETIFLNLNQIENQIDNFIEQKIAQKEGNQINVNLIKLGITKVLGSGTISRPLNITAPNFSKSAIEKIEAAGGSVIVSKA